MITIGLLVALGYLIASLDRDYIMHNWKEKRCSVPVMFAGSFFKPETDHRTPAEFASDNFEFCMKSYVDPFMALLLKPINVLLQKQVNITQSSMGSVNSLRKIAETMYNGFSVYLEQFYRRFNASIFEISKIMQFLRMAMRRMSAVAMSFIYMGLSLFNGMINSIQFILKVILIICGIMLAIIIILWFILLPVIPLILTVLGLIASTVYSLKDVLDPRMAAEAESKKGGFCFAEWTTMTVLVNEVAQQKSITDIQIGDKLLDGSYITAIIEMDGTDVPLYQIGSVCVSGSHLIKGTDRQWKLVASDERATMSPRLSTILYCFNTTSNIITIDGLQFRDWEEIDNDDAHGQMIWNYMVSSILHNDRSFGYWKDNLRNYVNMALVSAETLIKTSNGTVPIHTIQIGDFIVDQTGKKQEVSGIIRGEVEYDKERTVRSQWKTELYEYRNSLWLKGNGTIYPGVDKTEGYSLITEEGTFIINESGKEICVRDFTEVGYKQIYKTYTYVETRLRSRMK
jgi:hypothetical protein